MSSRQQSNTPHSFNQIINSDLAKTLSKSSLPVGDLAGNKTLSDLKSDLVEQVLHTGAISELFEQMQEQQRVQSDVLRDTLNPFSFPAKRSKRKRIGNPARKENLLRQENYELRQRTAELQQKNAELERQLRRHQRPMLPSDQPDGEFWPSLR